MLTRTSMTMLALALVASLAGCGWGDRSNLERAALDSAGTGLVPHGWTAAPGGQMALPPGHPPVTQGPGVLPPGHPPVTGSAACPGGGLAKQPEAQRFRDFADDPGRVIGI